MAGWDGWLSPSSDMCTLSSDHLCEAQWQGPVCGPQDGARAHADEAPTQAKQEAKKKCGRHSRRGCGQHTGLCSQSGRCLPPAMAMWGPQPICHTWGFPNESKNIPECPLATECHCRGCRWGGGPRGEPGPLSWSAFTSKPSCACARVGRRHSLAVEPRVPVLGWTLRRPRGRP